MNERVKQLAFEARLDLIHDKFMTAPQEKFAELIIRECCVTADANIDDSKYPSYWIKKKFGVEE